MALHKPVMIGVDFALGQTYNKDKTTEHFIVLVGAGIETAGIQKGKKYYRFFDVGTAHQHKGTNPKFKLYYDSETGFCRAKGFWAPTPSPKSVTNPFFTRLPYSPTDEQARFYR